MLARAAQCYKAYDGIVDMISECPPDSIFPINSKQAGHYWTSYDISNAVTGLTTAIISHGKGKLIILAYDLSRTNTVFLRPQWQKRMLDMLEKASVRFPVYWKGQAAVQCLYYGSQVALVNYNSNPVSGRVSASRIEDEDIELEPFELKIVKL